MSGEPTIKAIETRFKGFRFRSRLEARWAVFLDKLGVEWEYEKEGYDLGNGLYYLPDFYLPEIRSWIEVKGPFLERFGVEWLKASALASMAEDILPPQDEDDHYIQPLVYVFCGSFTTPDNLMGFAFHGFEHCSASEERDWLQRYPGDHRGSPLKCWWFQCPVCHRWQPGRNAQHLPCECIEELAPGRQGVLCDAVLAAKQARFEHGESG